MKSIFNPTLQLISASTVFGLGAVFVVFIQLDAIVIAFYRLFLGALLFGAILVYQRQSFTIPKRGLLYACLAGAMFGIDLSLWNQSIFIVGPGIATILNSLQVFFMAGFGICFFDDKPTNKLWASLVTSFFGVLLLCSSEIHTSTAGGYGIVAGIASALTFAFSMLALREAARYQKHSVFNTMFYSSIAGAVTTGIWALSLDKSFMTDDVPSWFMMFFYSSVVHVVAWSLMAVSMPHLSIAVVGLIFCLEPVVALFADLAFLDKSFSVWQIVGAAMTISAVYLGSQSKKWRPNHHETS